MTKKVLIEQTSKGLKIQQIAVPGILLFALMWGGATQSNTIVVLTLLGGVAWFYCWKMARWYHHG